MNKIQDVPVGHRLVVHHIHDFFDRCAWAEEEVSGGLRSERRKLPRYITVAKLYDETETMVAEGTATCSPRDNPSRKLGRIIAVNRCIKAFDDRNRVPFIIVKGPPCAVTLRDVLRGLEQ